MKRSKRWMTAVAAFLLLVGAMPALAANAALPSQYTAVNTVKGVTLSIKSTEYTGYTFKLNLQLRNKTKRDFGYGVHYTLEQWRDGAWYELPLPYDFPAIGLVLRKGKSDRFSNVLDSKCILAGEDGLLLPGKYRIVYDLIDEITRERCPVAVTFQIPEPGFAYAMEPVNIRTGPGTEYEIIRELRLAEEVRTLCKSGKWTQVRADGKDGYVYSKYLSFDEAEPYKNHSAVQLLGRKNVQGISVIGGDGLQYGCDKTVFVMPKKPYADVLQMRILLYQDATSAKAAFDAISKDGMMFIPDVYQTFYYAENYILLWTRDGFSDSRKVLQFYREMKAKLEEAYPLHTV